MYKSFSLVRIFLRRVLVVLVGVLTFPVMIFLPVDKRSRFYSYLHRYWLKISTKPVWLEEVEHGPHDLY
ncbi:DUF2517 family protein [Photobacterium chitinilyticum]|uniref:DUF2517 family protein n=1 Tax=Photobacterium chitinilyticum TaxID=2485123 RepID=A0A444JQ31_9GAMM|nr:DUF2517 family protein [Photobacterium chitinilyticum]RWX55195.1 DUF2517 family protein [Photobacterium chitinilyticum]